ncbi:PrpF domain-containing protein [Candidimonas nitroreducens]|uniref:PrpF protein n=1 Tax=Candidimonas nitroreducens TaxID=683354 RepID=A0A225MYR4_9BURK|nr:PrpF domain-containing protein [Candidimonas nitroreducens]OWT66398.1 hypothetical protein CEY11_01305 [Candidimonas nitroreducens]
MNILCAKVILMRGGTSRGPVLLAESLPAEDSARDAAVVRLVGGGVVQTDALGGGTPTTSKVVVLRPAPDNPAGVMIEYAVGNIVCGQNSVDWSGTCGNMTASVPVYALEEGMIPASWDGPIRLRNLSTGGLVETEIADMQSHERGQPATVKTRYLEPEGAVLGRLLPTGSERDHMVVDGHTYQSSLVDVTHPYLFLLYDEVIGNDSLDDPEKVALIERIRGECSVALGVATSPASANTEAPACPRVVLLHRKESHAQQVRISAVSMGRVIQTVPVTAAMCLAAARLLPASLVAEVCADADRAKALTVVSSGTKMTAFAQPKPDGGIASAEVERTARTIMQGTVWF